MNKIPKTAGIIILLLMLLPLPLKAQFIDNKFSLYAAYTRGNFSGEPEIRDNDFIMPSLFSNYSHHQGWQLKGLYKLHPWFSTGLCLSGRSSGNWQFPKPAPVIMAFENHSLSQKSVGLVLRIHTAHVPQGVFNRLRFYFDLTPEGGSSRIYRKWHSEETSAFYGLSASAGIDININQLAGFYLAGSYYQSNIRGNYFLDKGFRGYMLQGGIFLKLARDPWLIF